jgi:hypothetical protein
MRMKDCFSTHSMETHRYSPEEIELSWHGNY